MQDQSVKVAIIGAGCAGLAAASRLTDLGATVTLFEAAPEAGGRARSIQFRQQTLDNGQHILLGAYQETLRLIARHSTRPELALKRMPLTMRVVATHPPAQGKEVLRLQAPGWLPAPLHLLFGLISAHGLSMSDKWLAVRMMAKLHRRDFTCPDDLPLAVYLKQQAQSARLVTLLWEPLCLAALNTPLHQASTQVFLNVLRDSFAKQRQHSDMLLSKTDLGDLLVTPILTHVREQGGSLRRETVREITVQDSHQQRLFVVNTQDSSTQFHQVIVAVGPHQLKSLSIQGANLSSLVKHFSYQPITTVYLQYPPQVQLPSPMLGLQGGIGQWVFDRGQFMGSAGLLAVVISCAETHDRLTNIMLAEKVAAELHAAFQLPTPLWTKVITEKRATFACTHHLLRPRNETGIPGLYLAGDFVAAATSRDNYPATIEGAVRSGLHSAELAWKMSHRLTEEPEWLIN